MTRRRKGFSCRAASNARFCFRATHGGKHDREIAAASLSSESLFDRQASPTQATIAACSRAAPLIAANLRRLAQYDT